MRSALSAMPASAVTVLRSVRTDPLEILAGDAVLEASLAADPDAEARAELVEGTWPAGDGELAAPDTLGLGPGDELVFEDIAMTVTAVWRPLDAADPAWFGDTASIYASESTIVGLDVNPFARWTVLPVLRSDGITAADIEPLSNAIRTLDADLREAALAPSGLVIEGGLGDSLDTLARSAAAVRGVAPVPIVLAGVIGAVGLLQLGRLLASARGPETLLLRSRGRSQRSAIGSAVAEGLVVVVPAAVTGSLVASLAAGGTIDWSSALVAATVSAGGVLAIVITAGRGAEGGGGRGATAVTAGALVLSVVAAAVSIWQLRLYGSPVIATADGRQVVDPLASLAPALGLLAAGFAALALFAPLSILVERASSASNGVLRALASRQVARRTATFAVPVLLASLAVGGSTLAAAYMGTWSSMNDRAGALRNGADVRLRIPSPGVVGSPERVVGAAALGLPAAEAAPVLAAEALAGEQDVSLVAMAGESVGAVMLTMGGEVDSEAIGAAIATATDGIPLPDGIEELGIAISATTVPIADGAQLTPRQGEATVSVWVIDAAGSVVRIDAVASGDALVAQVPETTAGGWQLLALDLVVRSGFTPAQATFAVTAITADGESLELPASGWVPQAAGDDLGATSPDAGIGVSFVLAPGAPTVLTRLMPPAGDAAPIVVTDSLARRLELADGDPLELRFAGSGRELSTVITGTTTLLPGSTGDWGAIADLRAVMDQSLREGSSIPAPGEVWIASTDEAALAEQIGAVAPAGARITTTASGTGSELLAPVTLALVVGAGGGLVLAIAAVAAATAALERRRRPEVPVLKAAGLAPAQQARVRVGELAAVLAYATAAGFGGGLLVSALTVGELARSAVLDAPAQLATELVIEPLPLLLSLGAFAVACAIIVAVSGARVRAQATVATGREVDS